MDFKKKLVLKGWLICLIGAIFYWFEYLLRIEPSIFVNELMGKFNVAATGFGAIIALYYYAYTPMQLAVGVLIDRFGTKLIIGLGAICCTIGSFVFSMSDSLFLAGFSRFLIGFGSSFAFVGVLKLGAEWLPKKHFACLVGLATALGMIAGMTGDIVFTSLLKEASWENILKIGTIFGVFLIPVIFIFVQDTPNKEVKKNVTFKETFLGLKKIVKDSNMWINGFIACALYLSLSAFAELWGIKFLQSIYNLDYERASIACSFVFFGWLVGGPVVGWLSDHVSSRKIPLIIGSILAAITILIIIWAPVNLSFNMLSSLLFLFGAFSSAEILCFAISKEINEHHLAATSVAFTNCVVMIGGMVFQPLIGVLLDASWSGTVIDNVRIYSAGDYQLIFLLIPVSIIVGTWFSLKMTESLKK